MNKEIFLTCKSKKEGFFEEYEKNQQKKKNLELEWEQAVDELNKQL